MIQKLFTASALLFLLNFASPAFAGSATWNSLPGSGDWNTAANWTPNLVPDGPADTATFSASSVTLVSLSDYTQVEGIVFDVSASSFNITAGDFVGGLTLSGTGITNFSGFTQNFVTDDEGAIIFSGSATAGSGTIFTNVGGDAYYGAYGSTIFVNASTAGNGTFINRGGPCELCQGGVTQFHDSSTAGNGTFTTDGGFDEFASYGATTSFEDTATAGDGTFTTNGATASLCGGGTTSFNGTATAGNSTFTTNGATAFDTDGGTTSFNDAATADHGSFTTNGGVDVGYVGNGGTTSFSGTATAADGIFTTNGGSASGASSGTTLFANSSTAANATLIANGGLGGGAGGSIMFTDDSTGGAARVQVYENGIFDISDHNAPGITLGSIEGSGLVMLGGNVLTVGSNNLSTTFSGVIQDGSLTKIGSGTLVLSGLNTYEGGTTVENGTLTAAGDATLGAGSVTLAAGAILKLEGGVGNNYIADAADLNLDSAASMNLNFDGVPDQIAALSIDGEAQANGLYGSSESNATYKLPEFAGSGTLLVGPKDALENISTRLNVGTGDNVLIGGFIVTGSVPKLVLLRAIGPSLSGAGLSNSLTDPVLELHMPDGTTTVNDNWKDTQQSEIELTHLQPSNDLESAILVTLDPVDPAVPGSGSYTAIVRGKDSSTGIGLVEAYVLAEGAGSQLANISTRGFVQTGDNVMIGGVIIGRTSQILVRAIGPELAAVGVNGSLEDTTLDLHDENGTLITSNDDWKETQQSAIEATGLAPKDDRESAILITFQPSNYTAIVRGKNDTTGVALVEAYNLSP